MESADMQLVMFALIATIPLVGAMMAITRFCSLTGKLSPFPYPRLRKAIRVFAS